MARGQRLFEKGDYQKALLEYRNALQRKPDSAEAMYRLGSVLQRLDKPREAYELLTRATARLNKDHDAHLELAKLCLSMYMVNVKRPREWSEQVLTVANHRLATNPQSFDALRLRGFLAVADSRTEEAIGYLERANRARPGEADVVTVLAQNLLLTGRQGEAEGLAKDVMRRHPQYAPIYDTMYSYYLGAQRVQEAERTLLIKIENNSSNHLFAIQLCRHYRRTGQVDRMDAAVRRLGQSYSDGRLLAGDFLAETGRHEEALQFYKDGAAADARRRTTYDKRQAKVYLAAGRASEALTLLDQILTRDSKDRDARAYRAHAWMKSGNTDQLARAAGEFEELTKLHPESLDYIYSLSESYRRRGLNSKAEHELSRILKQQPDHALALQSMAELSIGQRAFTKALNYAEELLRQSPGNVSARLVQTASQSAFGRYGEARKHLGTLIQEHPNLVEARLQLALLEIAEKRYTEAERILRQVQGSGPMDLRLLRHWVELYGAQSKWSQALQMVQSKVQMEAPSTPIVSLLAQTAARSGNYAVAIETYRKLAAGEPGNPMFLERLGALHIDSGDLGSAVESLERARLLSPSDPEILARLGSALQLSGRLKEAEIHLRRSLDLAGNAVAMNNLAHLLAQSGEQLEEALRLAQTAVERMPNNLAVHDTLGLVYLRRDMVANARTIFERLVREESANPTFRHHLALTLLRSGEARRASVELHAALRLKPTLAERRSIEDALARSAVRVSQ